MPESFDSVDVAFSHLPRFSSFVSIITSSTSSFRSSFFRLNYHPFTLSLPFQLPSTPSSLLPLVAFDASPFIPTVPAFIHLFHLTFLDSGGTVPLPFVELTSFQLFVSLGNAFSLLARTFTSFLLPHLLSHSIPASEVSTY